MRNFQRWQPKTEAYERAEEEYRKEYKSLTNDMGRYGFAIEDSLSAELQRIRENVIRYKEAKQDAEKKQSALAAFESENDIRMIGAVAEPEKEDSLSHINEQLSVCREKRDTMEKYIAGYDRQLLELQDRLEELSAQKEELAERKENYSAEKKKYDLLLHTMEYLQRAKDSLTARYLSPVQSGFEKYFHMMSEEDASPYRFDASVNLTVEELGIPREIRFLSDGRRDLAGICTRMALIDAMYEDEKPFVILDDPFVNLDDPTSAKALAFLEAVSREYQVIYFTCSERRTGEKLRP
jgi:DNA repair exonuclease SbcCD ATPase subunit